jgi:hypothetical protein
MDDTVASLIADMPGLVAEALRRERESAEAALRYVNAEYALEELARLVVERLKR